MRRRQAVAGERDEYASRREKAGSRQVMRCSKPARPGPRSRWRLSMLTADPTRKYKRRRVRRVLYRSGLTIAEIDRLVAEIGAARIIASLNRCLSAR